MHQTPIPNWLPLAETAIAKLIDTQDRKIRKLNDDLDYADLDRSAADKLARPLGLSILPHDLRDELIEAGGDPHAVNPITGSDKPEVQLSPLIVLQAVRLAALIGSKDRADDLVGPGEVMAISGVDDPDLFTKVLASAFLPAGWTASSLRETHHRVASTLLVCAPEITTGRLNPAGEARFVEQVAEELATQHPLIFILPPGFTCPGALVEVLPAPQPLPPLDREMLIVALRHTHSATGQIDEAAVRAALPPDSQIARLTKHQVLAALRAPTARNVAERIADFDRITSAPGRKAKNLTLDRMTGGGEALLTARRMIADLHAWRRGEVAWSQLTRSVLFYGPPGTGKTWIARAMGASADVACVETSFAEWQAAGHLGDMLNAMIRSFAQARRSAPSVLFIDEVDAVGSRQDSDRQGSSYRRQVINGFLAQMDTISREEGVIVVGACNDPGAIDPAVLRTGRFDQHVEVPLPDQATLEGILHQHLGEDFPATGLAALARRAVGRSAADLDAAIRKARSFARNAGSPMTLEGVADALALSSDAAAGEWRVAVHECGHAIVATSLAQSRVTRLMLVPTGGETVRQRQFNASLPCDIDRELAVHMAGRAAEFIVFGDISGGAGGSGGSDLAAATELALAVHTSLGLGCDGPVWSGGRPDLALRDPELRARVRQRLEKAERQARALLADRRSLLIEMARALHEQRRLSGPDLEAWLSKVPTDVKAPPPNLRNPTEATGQRSASPRE